MEVEFRCCKQCYMDIGRKNILAADLWVTACKLHSDKPDYYLTMPVETKELRLLENMGFMYSTETDKKIYVFMLQENEIDDDKYLFCRNLDEHFTDDDIDDDEEDDTYGW